MFEFDRFGSRVQMEWSEYWLLPAQGQKRRTKKTPMQGTSKRTLQYAKAMKLRPLPKPGCWGIGFRQTSLTRIFYIINEAHKQYGLLDTIFSGIFYLGPPGKHLYLSPQNPLHVARRSRPTCSRFSWLFIYVFLEFQNKNIVNSVSERRCCLWVSFIVYN